MQAIVALVIFILAFIASVVKAQTPAPSAQFIPIEGSTLNAKTDAAVRQGQSKATRFWMAYSFDVRAGIAMDMDGYNSNNSFWVNGVSLGSNYETRNLGVFILSEPDGSTIARLEIYNLERKREYTGYPVYWLGRGSNDESLTFLKGIIEKQSDDRLKDRATQAIALHDDKSVGGILKSLSLKNNPEKVRKTAIFWLGQVEGEREFLAGIVRDEQEPIEVRKQAAFGIGISKDKAALQTLQSLYSQVTPRELKRQLIFATSINENKDAAVDFLINVASNDQDRELRKQSMFWLGQKAGDRSLKYLTDVVEKTGEDTEVQKQAVFAIGQRNKDEAIPLLIKIAKSHQNLAVRKQAIFWLGQSGDERALAFFKEVFAK
ncbi:MAG: HEAT repeat domain-containing protein [Acidobacteria bacterium]|nr:HEAT repeat domain-containing protein [Acidobacteriota bacterium]